MNKYFKHELDIETSLLKRYRNRMNSLLLLTQRPTQELLKQQYDALQVQVNRQYPDAAIRTVAERAVLDKVRCATNLLFYKSIWIGNRNVDLFCPAIGSLHPPVLKGQKIARTSAMRGLVIEIDGTIHDRELKMKKDTSKYKLLHELGIGLTVIHNDSINEVGVNNLIKGLMQRPRLDSRARRRILRKIYVATLAYHASDKVLVSLYGSRFLEAITKGVAE